MYQALLTRRYLVGKIIPLLAMLSVMLCTAMVIIVFSVMSGFLDLVVQAGRQMIGDVVIEGPPTGFGYYEEVVDEIRALPGVEAASAMIETYGLVKMPYNQIAQVRVIGIDPDGYDAVTGFRKTLYWRRLTEEEKEQAPASDVRLGSPESDAGEPVWRRFLRRALFDPESEALGPIGPAGIRTDLPEWLPRNGARPPDEALIDRIAEAGRTLQTPDGSAGMILGVSVSRANERIKARYYNFVGVWFLPSREATLTVLPLTDEGALRDPESRILPIVNEFSVERHDVDTSHVLVPFEVLQRMLRLHPVKELSATEVDEFGDPVPTGRMTPGRASRIVVKAAAPAALNTVREQANEPRVYDADGKPIARQSDIQWLRSEVEAAYDRVAARHPGEMPAGFKVDVMTWQQQIAQFIGAVKKETALVTTLFGIISLVAVFLVLSIFWTVVQQKTRDIGILRSVGASRLGVAWLFLRYGMILGMIGSLLGAGCAVIIVRNINPIHEFIGREFGIFIWDPKVYYFSEIPHHVNPGSALFIMAGGVLFATLGAIVPSIRAAFIDPVRALRYE